MEFSQKDVENIVRSIVKKTMAQSETPSENTVVNNFGESGVFDKMKDAIDAAHSAYLTLSADYTMEDRQKFVDGIKKFTLDEKNKLAQMVVDETNLGNYHDKILKHELAARSYGTEVLETKASSGDTGLSIIEMAPFGVIGATTPVTNPSETVIANSINMVAAGNTVVFNVHPSSKNVCEYVIRKINEIVISLGGPKNIITMVKNPSMESLNEMSSSPKINLLVGTGGPGLVSALLRSGKKAIGAGAGNPPVVVDETAIIEKAAKDIITGHSFDNNIVCILEKEVFVVDSVANQLISLMQKEGALLVNSSDAEKIKNVIMTQQGVDSNGKTKYVLNKKWVGQDPYKYLDAAGIPYSGKPKCIITETGFDHPFVQKELLMPILAIVRVDNVDEAIDLAVLAEHGNRHTAIMHSLNVRNLTKFAKKINTTIFVKNAPSIAGLGIGSEGTASFTIAGPTGEGITTSRTFTRARHCTLVDGFRII